MQYVYLVMFFLFGTAFGSFYNVLGCRIPNNESIIKPGSHCERCGHMLKWYELIPILSYIFLGGKCRNCKEKLSILYPATELFCGILFAVSYKSFGFSLELIVALTLVSMLILVISSDINYMIIPNRFIIVPSIIILIIRFIDGGFLQFAISLLGGICSFAVMYGIMKLGNFLFKKECLGGADVKLMFVVGLILPSFLSIVVVIIASFIALPVSIYLYIRNSENVIPFGPFLVLGLLVLYFMKINTTDLLNFLLSLSF